jgi:hypothetical protein
MSSYKNASWQACWVYCIHIGERCKGTIFECSNPVRLRRSPQLRGVFVSGFRSPDRPASAGGRHGGRPAPPDRKKSREQARTPILLSILYTGAIPEGFLHEEHGSTARAETMMGSGGPQARWSPR